MSTWKWVRTTIQLCCPWTTLKCNVSLGGGGTQRALGVRPLDTWGRAAWAAELGRGRGSLEDAWEQRLCIRESRSWGRAKILQQGR